MADSKRKTIIDAVVSAVSVVSSLFVSERLIHWEEVEKQRYPIVAFPIDGDETRTPFCLYGGSADNDNKGTLPIIITCYCYNAQDNRDTLKKLRTDLSRDISAALWGGTTLMSLVLDMRETGVAGDGGVIPCYSLFDISIEIDYLYNHTDGG